MPNNQFNSNTIAKSHQACVSQRFMKNSLRIDITGLLEGNANGR
jgi:hypothetical protein